MRVGAVTHRGYGELVLQRFGAVWGWFAAADLTLTNLITLVAEFVSIRVGLAYFHLGSGVAVALGLALVAVHLQRRALLALGAHRARHGPVQRPVPGRGDPGQAPRRERSSARLTSRRSPAELQHAAAAAGLDDRGDGHAMDDLLPAGRLGRQGDDSARHRATGAMTPRSARCWRRSSGSGRWSPGPRCYPRRGGHPGIRRRRIPRGAQPRRGRRRRDACSPWG